MTQATLTPLLRRPVSSLDDAKAWIQELQDKGLMFHFDDSPDTIGNFDNGHINGNWVPLFSPKDARIVSARVGELYNESFDWSPHGCPIGYALHVMGHVIEQD